MACETCDHTMQRVNGGKPSVFWCPRCGTLKTERIIPGERSFEAPKIVERTRSLCEVANVDALAFLIRAVSECITKAEEEVEKPTYADILEDFLRAQTAIAAAEGKDKQQP